jgi:hypothetical protein
MDTGQLAYLIYGLLLGAALAAWVGFAAWQRRRELVQEVERLRRHLHDHMEVTHEGSRQQKLELERLRQENENLRITVKAWQQRPDRRELRMLQVYDEAVRQVSSTAPGFAPVWEASLREAEARVAEIDRGLVAFARRLVRPRARKPSGSDDSE